LLERQFESYQDDPAVRYLHTVIKECEKTCGDAIYLLICRDAKRAARPPAAMQEGDDGQSSDMDVDEQEGGDVATPRDVGPGAAPSGGASSHGPVPEEARLKGSPEVSPGPASETASDAARQEEAEVVRPSDSTSAEAPLTRRWAMRRSQRVEVEGEASGERPSATAATEPIEAPREATTIRGISLLETDELPGTPIDALHFLWFSHGDMAMFVFHVVHI
jgi:hypothetical protein